MEPSALRKIVGLGVAAALLLTVMYVFALGKVPDSGVGRVLREVRAQLRADLAPGTDPRVEMTRGESGASAPREYEITIRLADAVALRPGAPARAADAAAYCAIRALDDVTAKVTMRCRVEWTGGSFERTFERVGEKGLWQYVPVAGPGPRRPKEGSR
ncbi:MAG: hypothetical protein HMLKMBBP_03056 [Planctomycetes bacterium]|nr:hypothetical protein [Planctomycetota bacterium]